MAEEKGSVEQFGYKQELHRTLSLWDLTVYGLLFMVIIAPHSIFGYVNRDAQGMAPLVYLVGFCAMFFTALSYVQMAKRFPIAGSVYSYVQRGVNPHVGFLAGWLILLDYVFVPSLLYIFVGNWCQSLIPQIPGWVWILIFIAVNTAINIKGIETTARVDMFFFVVEIGIVLIIVIGGLKYVLGGGGAGELTMTPIYQADKVNLTFIATACTIAALNFTGFDGISTLAEEVSEPEKNVGRAILIALVVIGTVFFLQTYIVCLIEPDYNKFNASTALFDACAVAIGDWFRIVLLVVNILAVGIANTLNAQAACSRVLFSMGRDRLLPGALAKVHPKFRTPYVAILLIGVAPAGESVPCGTPGDHGGNMATLGIREGAILRLPVFVKGAYLGLGDLHAAMGDGEVSVTGLEVFGEVDLDLSLEKGASLPCPLLHDGDEVSFLASAETVDGAIHASTGYMHDFLLAKTSLNADEALMLMSLCGHARISQIVDPLKTARFAMPVSVLAKFGVVVE